MNYLHHQISFEAIEDNYLTMSKASHATIGAVIKANGYGHGAVDVARSLERVGCQLFFAGTVNEACHVRAAGITGKIFPLLGITSKEEVELCKAYSLIPVLHTKEQIELMSGFSGPVALKCDTGMSRLGFTLHDLEYVIDTCKKQGITISYFFSHLSTSNDEESVKRQQTEFESMYSFIRAVYPHIEASLGNSSSVECSSALGYDIVRCGIALYGYNLSFTELRPAMEIYTKILQIRTLSCGRTVSYNNTFTAPQDMRVAVVACGYADGYSRKTHNGYMMIEGEPAPILGTICMQSCIVDISHIKNASLASKAYILQPSLGLSAATLATTWDTIPFEVLCLLGKKA